MDLSSGIIVLLLVTLLPAAVISCEGNIMTYEADHRARITCTFTGDMRNLYWFYQENEGMDRKKVLTYFKQEVTYHENYTRDHVQLEVETSTLVITSVSIADEGIYTCDVDRINQTAVLDIVSCLDVFVTPVKPFPQIEGCNTIGQEEICNLLLSAETDTNITCSLSGFYPDGNATLEWRHQDFASESSLQDDGTYIRTVRSNVSLEGNYTCEASYTLPNGDVTTGTKKVFMKEVRVDDQEVRNVGIINWTITGVLVALTAIITIIILVCWMKRREKKRKSEDGRKQKPGVAKGSDSSDPSGTEKEEPSEEIPLVLQGRTDGRTPSPGERISDTNISRGKNEEKQKPGVSKGSDGSDPSGTEKEESSEQTPLVLQGRTDGRTPSHQGERISGTNISQGKNEEKQKPRVSKGSDGSDPSGTKKEEPSEQTPLALQGRTDGRTPSPGERISDTNISRGPEGNRCVSDGQIIKLSTIFPANNYTNIATALGISLNESANIRIQSQQESKKAMETVLTLWKNRTGGKIDKLVQALRAANCAGLIDDIM